jgi:hypothetical protein
MKRPASTPTVPLEPKGSSTAPKRPSPEIFDPDEIENRDILETLRHLKDEQSEKLRADRRTFVANVEISSGLYGREATIVLGPPAAGKSGLSKAFARERNAALVDSDEAKKVLPEYRNGLGWTAVHEESSRLMFGPGGVFHRLASEGANMVIPKVGHDAASIEQIMNGLKDVGYRVNLVNMNVATDEAYRRMIGRFINTGPIIDVNYFRKVGDKPTQTYYALRAKAHEATDIDANGPIGSEKFLDGPETSLAQNIRSRRGRACDDPDERSRPARAGRAISPMSPMRKAIMLIFYLLMVGAGLWCAYEWLVHGGHRGIAFRAGGFLAAFDLAWIGIDLSPSRGRQ